MDCIKMVVTMNPCPCGYYPNRSRCSCSASKIRHYLRHVSMPILDRFDMGYEVPSVDYCDMSLKQSCRTSAMMKQNIQRAWEIEKERYRDENFRFNAMLPSGYLGRYCPMDSEADQMLQSVCIQKCISVRGKNKIIRVARTIADLEGSPQIQETHMAMAISLRGLDERYWQGELWV